MKQELWLSRDKGNGNDALYNIHEIEPHRIGRVFTGQTVAFCPIPFHRLVEGARLRKGRKKRIKRILIELED